MMFGIFGLAVSQADQNAFVAIIAGTVAGSISMYLIGKVFQLMKSSNLFQVTRQIYQHAKPRITRVPLK